MTYTHSPFPKTIWLVLLALLPLRMVAQEDNPYNHRGVQYATQGTDFWVCFPRTNAAYSANYSELYVVCERDCDVTVSAPRLDWSQTYHIMHRRMCPPDTNYIIIPEQYCRFLDMVVFQEPLVPHYDYTDAPMNAPQPRAFHVTSTDTISLFMSVWGAGLYDATNILPTDMLRDEYVSQVYPKVRIIEDGESYLDSTRLPPYEYGEGDPFIRQLRQTIDIVGVEDSTIVDIELGDWDILNRPKGDTFSIMLNAGEMYHMGGGEVREKYYPTYLMGPYYYHNLNTRNAPNTDFLLTNPYIQRHSFDGDTFRIDPFIVDLSGTHIKARDCKRIAVFEGGSRVHIPFEIGEVARGRLVPQGINSWTFDMVMEQAVPTRYAATNFLIPNIQLSDTDFIRITGLYDNTDITIIDAARGTTDFRELTVNKGETQWFEMNDQEGPFFIQTSAPAIVKEYADINWFTELGDEAGFAITPEEWWHHGQVNYGTISEIDEDHNLGGRYFSLYIFAHTNVVPSLRVDDYPVESYFSPISGTPYSYACFPYTHQFNSQGIHVIKSITNSRFMAIQSAAGYAQHAIYNLPHVQPGGTFLWVNGTPAQDLPADSIWCLYDPVTFLAQNKRPCDSVLWDFGDGTSVSYSHNDAGFSQPQVHLFQDTGRHTVQVIFKYEDEGCFTMKPDTLFVQLLFHNHYDSAFAVSLCEGSYTFRGNEFDTTGIYYVTTYWTPSGCDTLWQIDLVTCPHCHWEYDTVYSDQLPVTFNGRSFSSEQHATPIHLSIGDTCDSIIYYTLIIIPAWRRDPPDSTWVLVPNVFIPGEGGNGRFAVTCSEDIVECKVSVYDRRGDIVTEFDGLTEYWDGTSKGRICTQSSYVYYVRYIDGHDSSWKTLTGTVTLLR